MGDLQVAYTLFCRVNQSLLIIFSFVSIILNLVTVLFYIYVALIVLMKVSGIRQYRNKGKTGPSYLSQRHLRLLLRTWEKPGQQQQTGASPVTIYQKQLQDTFGSSSLLVSRVANCLTEILGNKIYTLFRVYYSCSISLAFGFQPFKLRDWYPVCSSITGEDRKKMVT